MKLKPNYLVIPLLTLTVAWLGSIFTSIGIESGWYNAISRPAWTPDGFVIGTVWTIIFILATISALIVWNKFKRDQQFNYIIALFLINGFLNFSWSFLFFTAHLIGASVIWAGLIALSVLILMILIWPKSKLASLLLAPYLGWVIFATYLTRVIWKLN